MNQDNPLLLAGVTVAMGALFMVWWRDYRAARDGRPNPHAFPGAVPAERGLIWIALVGTALLLGVEVAGEYLLGVAAEQTSITALFAVYSICAAFGEELIFRGYLVVTGRGRKRLVGSIIVFSLLFALAHPYLWRWEGGLVLSLTTKAWFTTGMLFAGSLWFYWLRFQPGNSARSLVPCIVAHAAKNAGVVAVKSAQGFVSGWW